MKATGIIRRIDELGRIVIPMELRKKLNICERDSLEIFTDDDGNIILKKYDVLPEINYHFNAIKLAITEYANYTPEIANKTLKLLTELDIILTENERT